MINVSFEALVHTEFGQSVRVVGNIPELGNWNPTEGANLQTEPSVFPKWRSEKDIRLPEGIDIEFKLVVTNDKSEVERWESLEENRAYTTTLSMESVCLRFVESNPYTEDFDTSTTSQSELITAEEELKSYSKLLTPFKIRPYPIIKSDQAYLNETLLPEVPESEQLELPPAPHVSEQGQESNPTEESQSQEEKQQASEGCSEVKKVEEAPPAEEIKAGESPHYESSIPSDGEREGVGLEEAKIEAVQDSEENYNDYDQELSKPIPSSTKYDQSGRIGYFYREKLEEESADKTILSSSSIQKTKRLKNELKQLAKCLPVQSSNSILVIYDDVRLDVMRVLIFGSEDTPYAHGAYVFDVFIPDEYPNTPPLVSIVSTKGNRIRFNPNLYAEGLVCLSLLGTWEGNSQESWDPAASNIYQVLVSIQSLVMCEEVYFNEPYYEHLVGTEQGEQCNRAYCNIVKFYNVSHAICDMIERPPPEFKDVILKHFYLKRDVLRKTAQQWIAEAEKKETALYDELITDHNSEIAEAFTSDGDRYRKDLTAEVARMEALLVELEKNNSKSPS